MASDSAPSFETIEELERWMRSRPRQSGQMLAARAALRAAPAMLPWLAAPNSFRAIMKTRALNLFRGLQLATLLGSVPEEQDQSRLAEALASAHWTARDTANKLDETAKLGRTDSGEEVHEVGLLTRATAAADSVMYTLGALIDDDVSLAAKAVNSASWSLDKSEAFRREIERDAANSEARRYRPDLTSTPLWQKIPEALADKWSLDDLDRLFAGIGDDWHVWSRWYRARMTGRPIDLAVERDIAAIPEEIWKSGPARANAEILRILSEHGRPPETPDADATDADGLPEARPSPLRFRVSDGVLSIEPTVRTGDDTPTPGEQIGWEMLGEAIDQLLGDRAAANNPLLAELEAARRALGETFEAYNPLRLGLIGITLDQLATRADEILLAEDAARFQAILAQQKLLIAQSGTWNAYIGALQTPMSDDRAEQEVAEETADVAREMIDEHPEAFDDASTAAIHDAAKLVEVEPSPDDPDPVAPAETRRSWLRVFGEMIRAFAADVLGEGRKVATKALGAGAVGVLGAVTAKLTGIADKLPSEYAWLHNLVQQVSQLVGL